MNILLAAFHTPGIRAIEYLIQKGLRPRQIRLLTHHADRNQSLLAFAETHRIESRTFPVNSAKALGWVKEFCPDVIFSLYFREIVPQEILSIPRFGAVNLHPGLLPKYRGCFSTPWVIINGEDYTGFTYHYMLTQVDAGNIILQRKIPTRSNDTAYSLYHRLIIEGLAALDEVFKLVVEEHYAGKPQMGESSYYSRKIPYGGLINTQWSRERIDRFVRAMYFPPFKGACVRLTDGIEQEVHSIGEFESLIINSKVQGLEDEPSAGHRA
jgi:methionyl-tRNA formyltransferase